MFNHASYQWNKDIFLNKSVCKQWLYYKWALVNALVLKSDREDGRIKISNRNLICIEFNLCLQDWKGFSIRIIWVHVNVATIGFWKLVLKLLYCNNFYILLLYYNSGPLTLTAFQDSSFTISPCLWFSSPDWVTLSGSRAELCDFAWSKKQFLESQSVFSLGN